MSISDLFQIRLYHGYLLQILAAEAVFCAPLKRREPFIQRACLFTPIIVLLAVVLPNGISAYVSGLFSLTIFLLSLLLCCLLFDNSFQEILYCCVCAQLTQNLSYHLENMIYQPLRDRISPSGWFFLSVGCMAIVYMASGLLFRRRTREGLKLNHARNYILPFSALTALFLYVMQYMLQCYGADRLWVTRPPLMVCCIFGLSLQYGLLVYVDEKEENARLESYLAQINSQYSLARANIDLINLKAHDLKHYIASVESIAGDSEELREIGDAVREYESSIRCGNATLDSVLTDKYYLCCANDIDFTIMAEGEALSFLRSADIVSLFSNLLDNAIACECGLSEREKRSVLLKVFRKNGFLCIHSENYCPEPPAFEDGLPVTGQEDRNLHGYGMKSMRYIARKYDGQLMASWQEHSFVVNILIPIPE